jgi:hypothetical protein
MFFKFVATGRSSVGTAGPVRSSGRKAASRRAGGSFNSSPEHRQTPGQDAWQAPASTLRRRPPIEIQRLLAGMDIPADDVLLSTCTDINAAGQYGEPWLVVTDKVALVFSEPEGAKVPTSGGADIPTAGAADMPVCLGSASAGVYSLPPSGHEEYQRDRNVPTTNGQTGMSAPPLHRRLTCRIELSQVSEFRCEGVIGSGLLQARVDGVFIDLLRYSNSLGDRFSKVCRKLERMMSMPGGVARAI